MRAFYLTLICHRSGSMDADHVVLGMLIPPGAGVDGVPKQTLWGFERVFVKAGETVTVNMYVRRACVQLIGSTFQPCMAEIDLHI